MQQGSETQIWFVACGTNTYEKAAEFAYIKKNPIFHIFSSEVTDKQKTKKIVFRFISI